MSKKKRTNYLRDGRAPIPVNEITSKIMSSIKSKNTTPEILLRKALWNNDVRGYRIHDKKLPGRPDIVFSKARLAIFVNGCFWHRCPHCMPSIPKTHGEFWLKKFKTNIERDKKKISELERAGWKVVTMWECEIKKNVGQCAKKICQMIFIRRCGQYGED